MPKILDWLKYYRSSLVDGSRGEKNNIFPKALQRNTGKLSSLTENEIAEIWDEKKSLNIISNLQEYLLKLKKRKILKIIVLI